jgi:hypothetical protein
MTMFQGFNNLNLSGVEAEKGRSSLKPGSYICITKNSTVEDTNDKKGKKLVVELHAENGAGKVVDFINIYNRSEKAQEFGLKRLKALLVAGGHPNPDHPGDVASINGLRVGVHVDEGEPWTDEKGVVRKGGGQPRQWGAYFAPNDLENLVGTGAGAAPTSATDNRPFNDRIPF